MSQVSQVLRKLSGATLVSGFALRGLKSKTYLGRIFGLVSGVETITTQYGLAQIFRGEFVAVKPDGSRSTALACHLPEIVAALVESGYEKTIGHGVRFGFDFYAVPSDKTKTGFLWEAQPLIEVSPADSPLAFAERFPAAPTAAVDGATAEAAAPAPEDAALDPEAPAPAPGPGKKGSGHKRK